MEWMMIYKDIIYADLTYHHQKASVLTVTELLPVLHQLVRLKKICEFTLSLKCNNKISTY
jgi:hypothetical protein